MHGDLRTILRLSMDGATRPLSHWKQNTWLILPKGPVLETSVSAT